MNKNYESTKYVVIIHGKQHVLFYCEDYRKYGHLNCDSVEGDFWFNKQSFRFQLTFAMGYVLPNNFIDDHEFFVEGEVTPFMEIGTCTPF